MLVPSKVLADAGKVLYTASKTLKTISKVLETTSKTLDALFKAFNIASKALETSGKVVDWPATSFKLYHFLLLIFSYFIFYPMRKLITNFANVPKMDIGPLTQNCLANTVGNPRYPNAKPLTDDLAAALTPYQAAAAILHATPTQTAELAQLRATLNQALSAVAVMANAAYPDDEAALLSTGLALGKLPERRTTLDVPTKFQLVDGPQPGTLCAKAKRPPHAVALKYLYTLDQTLPDNQWFTVVVRDGDGLLTACKTADRVYCKVAAVGGDTDQQPYTDVLTRLVQ